MTAKRSQFSDFLHTPTFEETAGSDEWRDRSNCKGEDTNKFFPGVGQVLPASVKKICANCSVSKECLTWALTHRELGFWAGTSDQDRRRGALRLKLRTVAGLESDK